jgi:hypothetical protein
MKLTILSLVFFLLTQIQFCSVTYISKITKIARIEVVPDVPSPKNNRLNFEIKIKIPKKVLRSRERYVVKVYLKTETKSFELEPISIINLIGDDVDFLVSKKYNIEYKEAYNGASIQLMYQAFLGSKITESPVVTVSHIGS